MEMKPGYKQTEVGVIPEDWDVDVVGNSFEICNQLRLPISNAARERMAGPYPYYGPTGIQGRINEYRVNGKYALIGEDGDHFLKWQSQSMTLLVEGKFNVNNHAHLVCGKANQTEWFYWYFSNRDITPHLTRQGAGRFKLTKASLLQIPCPLPSQLEQRNISKVLSDINTLIGSLEELIFKKRDIKQAAMQELLTGKRRLPGFEGEWVEVMLGEHATFFKGKGLPKSMLTAFGTYACVHYGELFTLYTESIHDTASYTSNADGLFFSQENDVLMPTSDVTPRGLAKASCTCRDGIAIGGDILVIRADSRKINGIFLSYLIRHDSAQILRLVTGTTVYHIYSGDMKKFTFRLPSVSEQGAIVQFLDDLGAELRFLETRLEKTQAIKQGMMQELLTGRIRLR